MTRYEEDIITEPRQLFAYFNAVGKVVQVQGFENASPAPGEPARKTRVAIVGVLKGFSLRNEAETGFVFLDVGGTETSDFPIGDHGRYTGFTMSVFTEVADS